MAHTNPEGARHEKRWQDVEDVLAAGIDVYTTLNIQHIETLNEAVARITGIRVRETVPDGVLDLADEIELIDPRAKHPVPPDDGAWKTPKRPRTPQQISQGDAGGRDDNEDQGDANDQQEPHDEDSTEKGGEQQ